MNEHAFKLFITKDFMKTLQNEFTMYTFIICNIIEELTIKHQVKALNNMINHIINAFETQILLIELKEYKNVFLIKNVNRLFLHEEHDLAIEITAESLYNLLYNLLNIKLMILKQYLDDVLMKE